MNRIGKSMQNILGIQTSLVTQDPEQNRARADLSACLNPRAHLAARRDKNNRRGLDVGQHISTAGDRVDATASANAGHVSQATYKKHHELHVRDMHGTVCRQI